jgi:hypothetical protein
MAKRLFGICLIAMLIVGAMAAPAMAQSSQVSQYVQPQPTPSGFDPGQAGELPFTGLMLLPLLIIGVLLILGAVALRRHRAQITPGP